MNDMVPDLAAVKSRQNSAWASGNYAVIGSTLQIAGETLCEAIDLRAGERVLDVAGGNGNAALAAARRWADVTCTDYVSALLDCARERGQADGLVMRFEVADAEALPFPDASFDAVLSTFGVMFTPYQERAAAGDGPGVLARRADRHGELDAERLRGPALQAPGRLPAATCRRALPGLVGHRRTPARAVSGPGDRGDAAGLQFPLPLGRAPDRGVPHLLRPGPQGIPGPGSRPSGRSRARHAGAYGEFRRGRGRARLWSRPSISR